MTKTNFDTVKKIGLALPGVEEARTYGASSLKVRGKLMACPALNKSAEPNSLMIRVSFDDRDALIGEDPDTYYVVDHYAPYPCVLVRLSRVNADALRDLLGMAWKFVTAESPKHGGAKTRRRPPSNIS
jgi:hypothetical protein